MLLNSHSSLSAWLAYIESVHSSTIDLGLERVTKVAQRLQLIKPAPYIFLVAGTNGKGTTCRMMEMLLLEAGYRVAVYSSPHLQRYTERLRVQNSELPESDWVDAFVLIEKERKDISLSYFEYSTLAAFELIKRQKLDIAIIEVGLGGRLDATNLIDADMAIITSIDIDHTNYLGSDRESIGQEKAGIFRTLRPAVVGEPNMPKSVETKAQQVGASLYACQPNNKGSWQYRCGDNNWQCCIAQKCYEALPFPKIPIANAATALAAISYSPFDLSLQQIIKSLNNSSLPGRMQYLQTNPIVIVDVAHNPHAAAYLAKQLQKMYQSTCKIKAVVGMLVDKDIATTLFQLQSTIDDWYIGTLQGERGASAEQLQQYLPQAKTFESIPDAFKTAMNDIENKEKELIIVFGSFITVASVIKLYQN